MIGTLFIRVDRNQSAPRLILKYTWYTRLFTKYTDSYLYLLHRNRKWRKIYWFLIGLGTLCWHWRSIFVVIFFFSLNTFYVCHKMKIYDNDHIMFVYSSYRFACGKGNTKLKSRTVSRGEWFYQNHKHIDMTLMNRKFWFDHHDNVYKYWLQVCQKIFFFVYTDSDSERSEKKKNFQPNLL